MRVRVGTKRGQPRTKQNPPPPHAWGVRVTQHNIYAKNLTYMGVSKHPRTMALLWGSLARGAGTMTRGVRHVQWRGSAPLVCERATNTTNKENKNKTREKRTKRFADKRPKKGLRASPRNPKTPWGQETHP